METRPARAARTKRHNFCNTVALAKVFAVAAFVSAVSGLPAETPPFSREAAWARAVEAFSEGSRYKTGRMEVHTEEFDGKDQLVKHSELSFLISYPAPGLAEIQLVRAVENGTDITEKSRKEQEAAREKSRSKDKGASSGEDSDIQRSFDEFSPFLPENQAGLSFGETTMATENGLRYQVVAYSLKAKKNRGDTEGFAWFDRDGVPFKVVYTMSAKLPGLHRMSGTARFIKVGPKAMVVTEWSIEYDATILFKRYKGNMRILSFDFAIQD